MDTAMRDLGRIEERDPRERPAHRVMTLGLAGLSTFGLVISVGALIGGADGASAETPEDPLAQLDRAAGLAADVAPEAQETEVDRNSLSFPDTLLDDGRPEVAESLAAAAAELAHLDPIEENLRPRTTNTIPTLETAIALSLPAGSEASQADDVLLRAATVDPMVATAVTPTEPAGDLAEMGEDGTYTVQVISYRTPEEANDFALSLRRRGHRAFVMTAEIPERGQYWRVRIGPFETRRAAESYRRAFERDEHMNTIVIRRRDD